MLSFASLYRPTNQVDHMERTRDKGTRDDGERERIDSRRVGEVKICVCLQRETGSSLRPGQSKIKGSSS